ncbi:MAG: hypothetical protein O2782_21730, partial [bacterium]|nr:hypothetical protein [bacterium]
MAAPLADTLRRTIDNLVIGPPLFDPTANLPNMVVYPVFPTAPLGEDPPHIITLAEGLRRGVRLSDTGVVSQVHVDNPLSTTILVSESEILVGPTQLRCVQFSCLVPPGRRASLPVNCVEAGQPTVFQAEFTDVEACPWYLRAFKLEQLARHGESHQHRIWDRIKEYLQHTRTVSSTQDVSAIYDQFGDDVAGLQQLFPLRAGQVGCICAVGQDIFVELFSEPEVLEDRYERVLRSALVEAVAHPTREVTPGATVRRLLDELIDASHNSKVVQNRSLRDAGRTQVFAAGGISGSGLVANGELIHLTAHKRCWGFGRPFSEQLGDLESDRLLREDELGILFARLERECTPRRKRYHSYLKRLQPLPAPVAERAKFAEQAENEVVDTAARPLPLNPTLHRFFLELFR